ncbi:hypothetical protein AB6F62_16635 [Providencia huaxiensis]|uniref:hypothetical protein n=1 Tax=Providencia huaxiensis TaxID=2027290 RepID=UPI0034DD44E8
MSKVSKDALEIRIPIREIIIDFVNSTTAISKKRHQCHAARFAAINPYYQHHRRGIKNHINRSHLNTWGKCLTSLRAKQCRWALSLLKIWQVALRICQSVWRIDG